MKAPTSGPRFPPAYTIGILAIFYTVGVLGILLPIHPDFILLTPLNLLLSLALVLWHHPDWSRKTIFFLLLTYCIGFGAELFGVQTGLLFGEYRYGEVLGPKLWETPLMIGVNWMLLAYCTGVLVNYLAPNWHWLVKGTIAALLMVGLDIFIEPVAIRTGFWSWANNEVPLRNYLGWFLVAWPVQCSFAILQPAVKNNVAVAMFILQFLFFLILGMV